jgi:hypothetical protein
MLSSLVIALAVAYLVHFDATEEIGVPDLRVNHTPVAATSANGIHWTYPVTATPHIVQGTPTDLADNVGAMAEYTPGATPTDTPTPAEGDWHEQGNFWWKYDSSEQVVSASHELLGGHNGFFCEGRYRSGICDANICLAEWSIGAHTGALLLVYDSVERRDEEIIVLGAPTPTERTPTWTFTYSTLTPTGTVRITSSPAMTSTPSSTGSATPSLTPSPPATPRLLVYSRDFPSRWRAKAKLKEMLRQTEWRWQIEEMSDGRWWLYAVRRGE